MGEIFANDMMIKGQYLYKQLMQLNIINNKKVKNRQKFF